MVEIIVGGSGGKALAMDAAMANRHGIISGATGSGKTVTLQVLAEGFSRIGVPVFMADIKGDLSGIAMPGSNSQKTGERLSAAGISGFQPRGNPSIFWDIFARNGHPVRATISDLGPLDPQQRNERMLRSPIHGRYETPIDRESAYELLKQKAEVRDKESQSARPEKASRSNRQSIGESLLKSAARSIGSQIGRQLIRGVMGSLLGGRRS